MNSDWECFSKSISQKKIGEKLNRNIAVHRLLYTLNEKHTMFYQIRQVGMV